MKQLRKLTIEEAEVERAKGTKLIFGNEISQLLGPTEWIALDKEEKNPYFVHIGWEFGANMYEWMRDCFIEVEVVTTVEK